MKIPKARRLPSGTWFIQLRLGGDSVPVTARTKKDVEREAALIKAQHRAEHAPKSRSNLTLRDAIERYIAVRTNTISPATIRGYTVIKKYRFQSIMDSPLKKIAWQAVCNEEAASCSAKTLKNAWFFVASVLKENDIVPPKIKLPQIIREERPFLDPEQIPLFIEAIRGKSCERVALLALHGLRRSEILAGPEIDSAKGIIKVRGAVVPDEVGKMVYKKENKSTSSRRDVPIMIPAIAEINGGNCIDRAYKQINVICRQNELPEVGIHGLRHSFASLAYHLKVPEEYVMQIGGWSDYGTVRRIYTHLAKADALKSQIAMTEFFKIANGNA